jgi:hypothetical protein
MNEILTEKNYLVYAARHYDNPQYTSTEEFLDDLRRIRYIKKLLTRYEETGDLKERLILNHIIILNNVFSSTHLNRILYLKLKDQFKYIKPFLLLLNILQTRIYNVGREGIVDTDSIVMDQNIINVLRRI